MDPVSWITDAIWTVINQGLDLVPFHWWLAILAGLGVLLWVIGGNRAVIAAGLALSFLLGFKTGKGEPDKEPARPVEPERPKRRTLRDLFRRK